MALGNVSPDREDTTEDHAIVTNNLTNSQKTRHCLSGFMLIIPSKAERSLATIQKETNSQYLVLSRRLVPCKCQGLQVTLK